MITFIVPAFNEGEAILDTIKTIEEVTKNHKVTDFEIIPIDDGSSDNSKEIIQELEAKHDYIRPVYHETNMGLGRSIIDGIQKASKERFLIVPGDNDVSPTSLGIILKYRHSAEMIMTLPINKEARSKMRQLISAIYQIIFVIVFGTSVGYLNGPGIWPTKKTQSLNLRSNRFSIISEMNIKLLTSGTKFAEVPIYLQAGEPTRSTVNLQNMLEVIKIFMMLVVDLKLKRNRPESAPLNRIKIDFANPST
ncbi:glycosyltransferase family 2 protein [Sneathiella glossodoripedis]|uniref:glycosyltransferase family 2 protein n=1 Tax=Sneathiella glossodoripedis TaxID=418853 RepID=UPI00046F3867|nr:glycosyltransferase family 2 protein [Sneathiella glossodoripedis]